MKAIDTNTIATVTSAIALTAAEKKEIEEMVSRSSDDQLSFIYTVDSDVLGGVKVEVGDLVLDSTIASQLKKVKTVLGSSV